MVQRQTEDDRRRQVAVATVFADLYDWELHEYESRFAVIDLYLTDKHRDQITGLCEVKCRPEYKHDEFDTAYVSFNKWYRLYLASVAFNVPGWIVFWYGADHYIRSLNVKRVFTQPDCNLAIRGRTGRKDAANDLEPMILVPKTLLHTVATNIEVDLMDNWQRTDWSNIDKMLIKCPVCCKFNYLEKQGDKFVNRCDVCKTLVEFSATATKE